MEIEKKYKELSEQEHVLLRPGMYVGSIKPEISNQFVFDHDDEIMVQKEIEYVQIFLCELYHLDYKSIHDI